MFHTQGCRLNQSETASLSQSFLAAGYGLSGPQDTADVVVINTCTVTENGDADTRRLVQRIAKEKPHARIALIGCQAQIQKDALIALPNVKWVVGNDQKMQLAELIDQTSSSSEPVVIVNKLTREVFTIPTTPVDRRFTRATIKIQDGCDFYCAFCVIPFARGPARSREFEDILTESQQLAALDYKEIVVTGINLGTYENNGKRLEDVLAALSELPGITRVRISSIEPTTISPEVVDKVVDADSPVCPYFHLPLQSGSDDILKAMNRHYTTSDYAAFVRDIAARAPEVAIGTDLIVGFPGETDDHFAQTEAFLTALPLAYFHVFSYSDRQYARSRKWLDKVRPEVIAVRSLRLRQLSMKKRHAFMERFLDTTQAVLFEQVKRGIWPGYTDHYIRVKVRSDRSLANRQLPVKLVAIENDYMIGELA